MDNVTNQPIQQPANHNAIITLGDVTVEMTDYHLLHLIAAASLHYDNQILNMHNVDYNNETKRECHYDNQTRANELLAKLVSANIK